MSNYFDHLFLLILEPFKMYSQQENMGHGFQICGENLPLRIGHVTRRMRSGCKRIANGILWKVSELITQERIVYPMQKSTEDVLKSPKYRFL